MTMERQSGRSPPAAPSTSCAGSSKKRRRSLRSVSSYSCIPTDAASGSTPSPTASATTAMLSQMTRRKSRLPSDSDAPQPKHFHALPLEEVHAEAIAVVHLDLHVLPDVQSLIARNLRHLEDLKTTVLSYLTTHTTAPAGLLPTIHETQPVDEHTCTGTPANIPTNGMAHKQTDKQASKSGIPTDPHELWELICTKCTASFSKTNQVSTTSFGADATSASIHPIQSSSSSSSSLSSSPSCCSSSSLSAAYTCMSSMGSLSSPTLASLLSLGADAEECTQPKCMQSGWDAITRIIKEHLYTLPHVQGLITTNLPHLPHLQRLVHDHYFQLAPPPLKQFHTLPTWITDNKFITDGYRPELLSFRRCFNSLFYVHNETGNIYSHALGALGFLGLLVYMLTSVVHDRHTIEQIVLGVFFMTAVCCMGFSAVFHCCYVHSQKYSFFFNKLDYTGITLLIVGSIYPILYFMFYCHPNIAMGYMGLTTVFGSLALWMSCVDVYTEPHEKWVRVMIFILLSATGIVPFGHYAAKYGLTAAATVIDVNWLCLASFPFYLIGALIYVVKVPECFFPGRFDFWFHSHQLWHMFVVFAALSHFVALWNMFEFRRSQECMLEHTLNPALLAHPFAS